MRALARRKASNPRAGVKMKVYFADFFGISANTLEAYGAFNISLINDLPVFIDPFLLFNSKKIEYQALHDGIIQYLRFLREMSEDGPITDGLLRHWFLFPEVKQNWLGYCKVGNSGSGLGRGFATAMNSNLATIFADFGAEKVTKGSHLEKICLINDGVGKDNISDFTTNLIKGFLCRYTAKFARAHLAPTCCKLVQVTHASFDYDRRRWISGVYCLPYIDGDFVLLTPKDILTKDDAWINKHDIVGDFDDIVSAIPNAELRATIEDYFLRQLPKEPTQSDRSNAIGRTLREYPELIDRYIRRKEDNGGNAVALSKMRVNETEEMFYGHVTELIRELHAGTEFYARLCTTHDEAYRRLMFLKQVIEDNGLWRVFYVKGQPVGRESDLQLMFRLTWYASPDDVNAEVNNGRGPVDYKISRGSGEATLVEFKLAKNSKLRQNLANQVAVYKKANRTDSAITAIMFYTDGELDRLRKIMNELDVSEGENLVLIDARSGNKESGSNAK